MYYPPRKKPEQASSESRDAMQPPELMPSGLEPVAPPPPPPPPEAQAEAPAPPVARRRRSCLAACLTGCLVVFLIVVVVPSLLYYLEYRRCSGYVAARDPLFDTYAHEVIDRQAPRLFLWAVNEPNPVTLPDEVLAGWENEFGDDPRYWQLRYNCTAEIPPEIVADYEARGLSPRLYYLEQARERGIADLPTLWTLWAEYRGRWLREYEEQQGDPEYHYWQDKELNYDVILSRDHSEEMRAFLDEMVAVAPDWSWPYYRRARFNWFHGDYEKALADIKEGNTAPVNRYPATFPYDVVIDSIQDQQPVANHVVQGGLLLAEMMEETANYKSWKQFGREIAETDQGNYREWQAEFHRFACRFGTMDGINRIDRVVSSVLVSLPIEELLVERTTELTPAQRRALLKLYRKLNAVQWEVKQQMVQPDVIAEDHNRYELLSVLSFGIIWCSSVRLHNEFYYWRSDFLDIDGRMAEKIQELAGFDYLTMSWPEEDPASDAAGGINSPGE